MNKLYMGIDIGKISVKGVIIDEYNNIISSSYIYVNGNPIESTKKIINNLKENIDLEKYTIISTGVTGSSRKLVGLFLDAQVIKNDITSVATGVMTLHPEVKTILEIGGQNSKIISIDNNKILKYDMNTSCYSGIGYFLDIISKKFNIDINNLSNYAYNSKNNIDIQERCNVYLLDEIDEKIEEGYNKEDIISGVCKGLCKNYVNNVINTNKIKSPIILVGGITKNNIIIDNLKKLLKEKIIISPNSHLMGAIGVSIIARDSKIEKEFKFNLDDYILETKIEECNKCSNKCPLIKIYKNNNLVDYWGNKCEKELY